MMILNWPDFFGGFFFPEKAAGWAARGRYRFFGLRQGALTNIALVALALIPTTQFPLYEKGGKVYRDLLLLE